jgi:predicted glycosyltransferase
MHRKEQIIRARCMEGLGLVNCLESDQTGAEMLFESVRSALKNREEPLSSGRARGIVPLDGSGRASELAIRLVRSRDTFEQVAS